MSGVDCPYAVPSFTSTTDLISATTLAVGGLAGGVYTLLGRVAFRNGTAPLAAIFARSCSSDLRDFFGFTDRLLTHGIPLRFEEVSLVDGI